MFDSRMCRVSAVMVAFIGSDGPAVSQDVSEGIVDTTVGKWLLTLEDGSLACHVTLEKVETIGCRVVTKVRPCGPPWHDELAAWEFSDAGIVLRDATRKEILTFQEQEGGPWKIPIDVSPVIYFIPEPGKTDLTC